MENKKEFIMHSLSAFLKKHSEEASISSIDDIVLSYMISILEDLGSPDSTEESFDVDSFSEMMDAYLPGFCNIQCIDVCEWMFELATQMSDDNGEKAENTQLTESKISDILKSTPLAIVNGHDKTHSRSRKCSGTSSTSSETSSSPLVYIEPDSPRSFKDDQLTDQLSVDDDQVDLLQEMFPACCRIEVAHCLGDAGGDMEAAVQLLMRKEAAREGLAQSMPKKPHKASKKKSDNTSDDKKMRDIIVRKYAYVDLDEDKRVHRPPPQKSDPKKMTRYLNGKVVSTKGERFTEIKKEEDDLKKNTANRKFKDH